MGVDGGATTVPGSLDIGHNAVLFYGLALNVRVYLEGGMAILPYDQARAFVDDDLVKDLAPPGTRFPRCRSV